MSTSDKEVDITSVASENENENESESDYGEEISMADLLQTFFSGSEGENIVDTLGSIKKTLDSQNKILLKLVSILNK